MISEWSPTNKIRWLDIGVGNGKYTKKIINKLISKGFEIELDALDPDLFSFKEARVRLRKGSVYNCSFEKFELEKTYDVINICQSFYYLNEFDLNEIVECLSDGGIIVTTLWSSRDVIYKIHKSLFNHRISITAEDFYDLIKSYQIFSNVEIDYFRGSVNLKDWLKLNGDIKNILKIICRYPNKKELEEIDYREFINLIKENIGNNLRENGVILAKKRYDMNWINDNEKSLKNLKLKFPSFCDIVYRMKGDNEAKFMCSWEKEGDYLGENLKGDILELCCGIGGRTVIVSKYNRVIAIDNNIERVNAARFNAELFGSKNVRFVLGDVMNEGLLRSIKNIKSIIVDADWRSNTEDPIKKHSVDPLESTPKISDLHRLLRKVFPDKTIVYKISPMSRVQKMQELGNCIIEKMYLGNKFSAYNVYYSSEINENVWREVYL